jgi:hypothetical protein
LRIRCLAATEACDPAPSQTYTIGVGLTVEVSNFVTPYYFTDNALGSLSLNLSLTSTPGRRRSTSRRGSYQIQMKAGRVQRGSGSVEVAALDAGEAL